MDAVLRMAEADGWAGYVEIDVCTDDSLGKTTRSPFIYISPVRLGHRVRLRLAISRHKPYQAPDEAITESVAQGAAVRSGAPTTLCKQMLRTTSSPRIA